jgi:hypothetical protein
MTQSKSKTKQSPQYSKQDTSNLPAQPGDIWESNLKNTFGTGSKLMVTDEDMG